MLWAEGYLARRAFRLVCDCPHPFGSRRARDWCRGYRDAMREEGA